MKNSIVLGGGCFWGIGSAFKTVDGVSKIELGYAGGDRAEPSYEQVCTGLTNHAEVVRITYDSSIITTDTILKLFFHLHDPTSINRQGADFGSQYRSIILYTSTEQKNEAEYIASLEQKKHSKLIMTEIQPLVDFWPAEEEHHDFFEKNPTLPYCLANIAPKLEQVKDFFNKNEA